MLNFVKRQDVQIALCKLICLRSQRTALIRITFRLRRWVMRLVAGKHRMWWCRMRQRWRPFWRCPFLPLVGALRS